MKKSVPFARRFKQVVSGVMIALAASVATVPAVQAKEKDSFKLAWSIYAGWIPWKYIDESGLMKKWADKYGITVEIVQINVYIE